jgi:urease accessory protein
VRTTVELVAELADAGGGARTVVRRARAGGHLALRETGPGVVHLVGTAAGPLGGDEVTVHLRVGAGARLAVRGAAATLVHPSTDVATSVMRVVADVADGGHLDLAPEPTIVCAGADLTTATHVTLAGSATLRLLEEVVLGRANEAPGRWRGRTVVTRDGVPVLSHTLRSDVLGAGPGAAARAVVTLLEVASGDGTTTPAPAPPGVHGNAVVLPLAAPGAVLTTAFGAALTGVRADVAAARTTLRYASVTPW